MVQDTQTTEVLQQQNVATPTAGTIGELQPMQLNKQAQAAREGTIKRKGGKFAAEPISANFNNAAFRYGWVPTDAVLVGKYQRKLQRSKIIKMAHNWDQNKVGTFVVNHRTATGQYFVIDGQHRHAAMQLIENYPTHIYCQIFENLSYEDEAQMFHDLDSERDNLTPGAKFTALIEAKNPVALGIKDVAERAGYTVMYSEGPKHGNLRAYKTLQDIFRRTGSAGLYRILATSKTAWPNNSEATSEPMLRGLELFFQKYPQADDARLVKVLGLTTPMYVIATARRIQEDLSSVIYSAVAQTIRGIYNKGLRYKLPNF